MKTLFGAILAAAALGGCVAVPAYPDGAYYPGPVYYPAPAASVGVYVGPPSVYYYGGHRHRHRHWR